MSRRGRARKTGQREPNGRLQRKWGPSDDVRAVATSQPHRRWLPEDMRRDQRAECELGRLFLRKQISETACEAGEKWRGLVHAYLRCLAAPVGPVSVAARAIPDRVEAEPEGAVPSTEVSETEEERHERVLRAFSRASQVLADCGRDVAREIDAVVVKDELCASVVTLTVGLDALAAHWQMGEHARSGRREAKTHVWRGDA